ncbi:hypothetical protein TNCV_3392261 [Trichonephila clavipes]|nr:hypothetical protein TNCV_3392261 [Trichonephila clavipes]
MPFGRLRDLRVSAKALVTTLSKRSAQKRHWAIIGRVPPSQYGGYDPWLVTEWVRVRIPSKAWLCLLQEKKSDFLL